MNLDKAGPIMKGVVSTVVMLALIATVAGLFAMSLRDKDFPPGIKETILVCVGVLVASFKDVVSFWLGGSHSSDRKTEIMASPGETK